MVTYNRVNVARGNDLWPDGTKPYTWTNVDFALVRFRGIYLGAISQWIATLLFWIMSLKISYLCVSTTAATHDCPLLQTKAEAQTYFLLEKSGFLPTLPCMPGCTRAEEDTSQLPGAVEETIPNDDVTRIDTPVLSPLKQRSEANGSNRTSCIWNEEISLTINQHWFR